MRLLFPVLAVGILALGGAGADSSYTVQAGDTLTSLARQSGSTPEVLRQLNGLTGDLLRVGQMIRLPESAAMNQATVDKTIGDQATVDQAIGDAPATFQSGMAVYYPGRPDSRTVLTAAHLSLPFGTWVEVVHTRTGRSVLVMINDRGPFGRPERVIDLSQAAARALGILGEGVAPVTLRIARAP